VWNGYRDLDGWDALLFLAGAVVVPTALVLLPLNLSETVVGGAVVVGGLIPCQLRRTFWPSTIKNTSQHSVLTLLLVAVGGFVVLIGLLFGAVLMVLLREPHDSDTVPRAILIIPLGVLVVGALLMFTGMRLARPKG
jgi:hypothetical protein